VPLEKVAVALGREAVAPEQEVLPLGREVADLVMVARGKEARATVTEAMKKLEKDLESGEVGQVWLAGVGLQLIVSWSALSSTPTIPQGLVGMMFRVEHDAHLRWECPAATFDLPEPRRCLLL
jgi:hypothetical protein